MQHRSDSSVPAGHSSSQTRSFYSGAPTSALAPLYYQHQHVGHPTNTGGPTTTAASSYGQYVGHSVAQFTGSSQALPPHYHPPGVYQSGAYPQSSPYISVHSTAHAPPPPSYPPDASHHSSPLPPSVYTPSHNPPLAAYGVPPPPVFVQRTQCEWANCRMPLDDDSSGGIQRHLREFHFGGTWSAELQGRCAWRIGGAQCGKGMKLASLGKHVAECHLHSTMTMCPHCERDYSRGDAMRRHLRKAHGV